MGDNSLKSRSNFSLSDDQWANMQGSLMVWWMSLWWWRICVTVEENDWNQVIRWEIEKVPPLRLHSAGYKKERGNGLANRLSFIVNYTNQFLFHDLNHIIINNVLNNRSRNERQNCLPSFQYISYIYIIIFSGSSSMPLIKLLYNYTY